MSGGNLTASDILALTKDNDGGYGGWFWIIILFIFVFAFSGGMFGGNNKSDVATTSELYASIGNQNLMNDVRTGFSNTAMAQCNTDKEVLNNRFTTQVGFQNLGAQMDSCCLNYA